MLETWVNNFSAYYQFCFKNTDGVIVVNRYILRMISIIIVPHNDLKQGVLVVERNALNDPSQLKTSLFGNFPVSSNYI